MITLKMRAKSFGLWYEGAMFSLFLKRFVMLSITVLKVLKDIYCSFNEQLLLEATRLMDTLVFLA